jgi:uncharacterized protein (TIGR02118 family)
MVKYTILLKRRGTIDRATFLRLWREDHLPLISQLPGVQKIELHEVVDVPNYPSDYDGLGMLWFDSVEAALAAFASPEGQAARQDTPRFADSGAALRFFVEVMEAD